MALVAERMIWFTERHGRGLDWCTTRLRDSKTKLAERKQAGLPKAMGLGACTPTATRSALPLVLEQPVRARAPSGTCGTMLFTIMDMLSMLLRLVETLP